MSSEIANQNRIVSFRWLVDAANRTTDSFSTVIIVPFLVDEIRVIACRTQAYELDPTKEIYGRTVTISSSDLFGGNGTLVGHCRSFAASRINAGQTVLTSNQENDQLLRYIYPASAKRTVNGSFNFFARDSSGDKLHDSVFMDFEVIVTLEFIQYKEQPKLLIDDDLTHLHKSGRRRL